MTTLVMSTIGVRCPSPVMPRRSLLLMNPDRSLALCASCRTRVVLAPVWVHGFCECVHPRPPDVSPLRVVLPLRLHKGVFCCVPGHVFWLAS